LQETLIQLIQNARAAMAGMASGALTIEATLAAERLVRVTVRDTGRGISPEHLPRIFDPFFTTKTGDWGGVGMGLSVVHKTIEDHGGTIQAHSEVGKGTTFVMTFPSFSSPVDKAPLP
jgi:signal transduction histidine kinase